MENGGNSRFAGARHSNWEPSHAIDGTLLDPEALCPAKMGKPWAHAKNTGDNLNLMVYSECQI